MAPGGRQLTTATFLDRSANAESLPTELRQIARTYLGQLQPAPGAETAGAGAKPVRPLNRQAEELPVSRPYIDPIPGQCHCRSTQAKSPRETAGESGPESRPRVGEPLRPKFRFRCPPLRAPGSPDREPSSLPYGDRSCFPRRRPGSGSGGVASAVRDPMGQC